MSARRSRATAAEILNRPIVQLDGVSPQRDLMWVVAIDRCASDFCPDVRMLRDDDPEGKIPVYKRLLPRGLRKRLRAG